MKTKKKLIRNKLVVFMAIFMIVMSIPMFSVFAARQIGDKLGDVLHSDVTAYINGDRIPCYNINGYAVILTKDLVNYGFDAAYNNTTRTTNITWNGNKPINPVPAKDNVNIPGTVASSYVYTDIVAHINGRPVDTFIVEGYAAIFFSELSEFGRREWDASTMQSRLFTVFSVSGRVSSEGAGVPGANVRLINSSGATVATTLSTSNGNYTFQNVSVGTYTISANLEGYTSATLPAFTVAADVSGRNLTLERASFSVSGRIRGSDASGGIAAMVQLRNSGGTVISTVHANSLGNYTFAGIAPGTYTIQAIMSGYNNGSTSSFTVSTSNLSGRDLTLQRNLLTVGGRIRGSDASSGIAATVYLLNSNNSIIDTTTANSSGTYSFSDVTPGTYRIEASMDGYTTNTSSAFTVSSANVTGRDLTLDRAGFTVGGRITANNSSSSNALSGAVVRLLNSNNQQINSTTTDSSGYYTFNTVQNGSYRVEASFSGHSTEVTATFSVTNNNVTRNLILYSGHSVSGRITSSINSAGLSGASVRLLNTSGSTVASATTDSNGNYTISNVSSGTYTFEVTLSGHTTHTETLYVNSSITRNISLVSGHTVSGFVRDSDNNFSFVSGVNVVLYNSSGSVIGSTTTNSSGAYSFSNVPTGNNYYLQIFSSLHQTYTSSFFNVSASITNRFDDIRRIGHNVTVQLSGINLDHVSYVTLTPIGSSSGVARTLNRTTNNIYSFTDMPSGTYVVMVFFSNTSATINTFTSGQYSINSSQTIQVNIF